MEAKLRIAILKDWHHSLKETCETEDGIVATWQEIKKHHDIKIFTKTKESKTFELEIHGLPWCFVPDKISPFRCGYLDSYNVAICWGSLDRPWHEEVKNFGGTRILQFAGGPTEHENLKNFHAVGCQSQVYIDAFKAGGVKNIFRSFGTNTHVFKPNPSMPKWIDAIYPASFCYHKNIELFAKTFSHRGIVMGNWNNEALASKAMSYGTPCLERIPSKPLANFYQMARATVITCGPAGGAQRCVLESMACGTPVIVMSDHDKCVEFVKESGFGFVCDPFVQDIQEVHRTLLAKKWDYRIGVDYIKSKWTQNHQYQAYMNAIDTISST